MRRELAATDDQGSAHTVPRDVTVQFVVGAHMVVLAWWLDSSAKLSPKTIDAMFRRLATAGVGTSADVKNPVAE